MTKPTALITRQMIRSHLADKTLDAMTTRALRSMNVIRQYDSDDGDLMTWPPPGSVRSPSRERQIGLGLQTLQESEPRYTLLAKPESISVTHLQGEVAVVRFERGGVGRG